MTGAASLNLSIDRSGANFAPGDGACGKCFKTDPRMRCRTDPTMKWGAKLPIFR